MPNTTNDTKSAEYFSSARPDMLKYIPADIKTMLEVGCGEGHFAASVKKNRGAVVWAIEPQKQVASRARKLLDRVLVGTIENSSKTLPDRFFDCIVFNDVLEHLIDPWATISGLKRKLTPSGVIVASIPNFRYWPYVRDIFWKGEWKYESDGVLDSTHLRFFTYKSIRNLFESQGFDIVMLEGFDENNVNELKLFNFLTGNRFWDLKYLHFACVARPKS